MYHLYTTPAGYQFELKTFLFSRNPHQNFGLMCLLSGEDFLQATFTSEMPSLDVVIAVMLFFPFLANLATDLLHPKQ